MPHWVRIANLLQNVQHDDAAFAFCHFLLVRGSKGCRVQDHRMGSAGHSALLRVDIRACTNVIASDAVHAAELSISYLLPQSKHQTMHQSTAKRLK